MAIKKYGFLFLTALAALNSEAAFASGINVNDMLQYWGNPSMLHCAESDMGAASIGKNKATCTGNNNNACKLVNDRRTSWGVLMLVAREVNQYGAKFCPTTVYGEKKTKGKKTCGGSYTIYSEPDKAQTCFWLCKSGHYGEGCQNITPSGCDSSLLRRSDFDTYSMSNSSYVENSIAMFHWDQDKRCGSRIYFDEHDMILGISDWLPNGHGAVAQPFVVRSTYKDGDGCQGKSFATVRKVGTPTILCKNGYKLNAAGTDCEPADATACAQTNMCAGWDSTLFDADAMVMHYNDSGKCWEYRCTTAGYGFISETLRTCSACPTGMRNGVSPKTGMCIQCPNDKIFDANASGTNYCGNVMAFSKSDMMYGRGKTIATQPRLQNQCWPLSNPSEYKDCVKNGGRKSQTSSVGENDNPVQRIPNIGINDGLVKPVEPIKISPVAPVDNVYIANPYLK